MLTFAFFLFISFLSNHEPIPAVSVVRAKSEDNLALLLSGQNRGFKNSLSYRLYNSLPPAPLTARKPRLLNGLKNSEIKHSAKSVSVVDVFSDKILYESESALELPLASLTKLATAMVLLASETPLNWSEEIDIEREDVRAPNPRFFAGEKATIRELFLAMLVGSDNTAAATLARWSAGSEEIFVKRMNDLVKEMNLRKTNFADATGLNPNNKSTAREAAILARAAFAKPLIMEAASTESFQIDLQKRRRRVRNTNELLASFLNQAPYRIMGGKTGYIDESRYNLALQVENDDGHKIIAILLGSETSDERSRDAQAVLKWVFDNYKWQ